MACQLPTDCLDEILGHLENDKTTLYSCLLVNRLWCKISVRILWRNIGSFKNKQPLSSSILSTLIACLPNESKELLCKNEIFIPTPTSKPPLFNYPAFCKVLSFCEISRIVALNLEYEKCLVINEVIKMFTNQISSLKKLISNHNKYDIYFKSLSFTYFSEIRDLLELHCNSNLPSEFFCWLSQTCHNLQSISITFYNDDVSLKLKELISLQNNLKNLTLIAHGGSWARIIPALTKHSSTVTRLHLYYLYGEKIDDLPLLFVGIFSNLQEIIFSFFNAGVCEKYPEDFRKLQYANFPKLQILKFSYKFPKPEYLMKFLENNGKNLKEFYIRQYDNALNLSIANFCPNLKSLFVIFNSGELYILKTIFIICKYLESIKIWCGKILLTEKEVLETVANYSSNNFCELKLYNSSKDDFIHLEDLESFFISWKNRTPKKLLRLIFIDYIIANEEIIKIIEKYENLGIIKFETKKYEEDDRDYY